LQAAITKIKITKITKIKIKSEFQNSNICTCIISDTRAMTYEL